MRKRTVTVVGQKPSSSGLDAKGGKAGKPNRPFLEASKMRKSVYENKEKHADKEKLKSSKTLKESTKDSTKEDPKETNVINVENTENLKNKISEQEKKLEEQEEEIKKMSK